ncbi:MAG: phycobilisome protein [Leptolyngbya sp. SIO1D8]|nr:phycobilisome protein [Leptolyngbya sp. SIO1D8]
MFQQLEQLCTKADGRYATDAELSFFQSYLKTARLRFSLYQKIQKLEPQLIKQVLLQMKRTNPDLLTSEGVDITAKCQRDASYTLRYIATALLTDDPDVFRDRMLVWLQTIMKSFKSEHTRQETYRIMHSVIKQALTPEEAEMFLPLLEMSRMF